MAARREQWESWLLAGRSAKLITDGDVPEENYFTFLFLCVACVFVGCMLKCKSPAGEQGKTHTSYQLDAVSC